MFCTGLSWTSAFIHLSANCTKNELMVFVNSLLEERLIVNFESDDAWDFVHWQCLVLPLVVLWCCVMGACHTCKGTISSYWWHENGATFKSRTETTSTQQLSLWSVSSIVFMNVETDYLRSSTCSALIKWLDLFLGCNVND